MAGSLLSGIAEGVLGKIASRALQEAVAIYGVENQISELRETLTAIKAVLLDAEEQQAKNHRLQVWLDRLRDVLYDAEDVLDQVECEALRKQVISRYGGSKEKVCRFFTLSNPLILRAKLSDKVKEIREKLSKISTEKDQFNLNLNVQSASNDVAHTRSREMTYSFVNESDVVGRNIDKEKIIEMLRQADDKNVSVIPIVGLGGLGKTALAKLVFNDDSVKEQFEMRIWVCVPENFDLKTIIEEIIKDSTRQSLGNFGVQQLQTLGIQQLQTHLQNSIKDKKYLLVLDDVWSNDRRKWKELRDLLSVGASENKIIVTTRSSEIASIMGTHPAHNLKGLSHENSMALFKKWAFDEKEKEPCPKLLAIGNDIIEKSKGVPLLVKTLGSLLYTKDEELYWKHIRDSETWDLVEVKKDIMPILKLSYDHLPSHLKRCFFVLSLFPRGHRIKSSHLIELWMALGVISPTRNKLGLEDVGVEYVKELWKRSLIQEVEELDAKFMFKVHDLVHSLAMSVAQNEYSIVGLDTVISEGIRYVSFSSTSLEGISNFNGVPPFLRKPTSKRLRRILFQSNVGDGVITKEFARICISKCNSLLYLNLSNGSFEELPSSISNLKQLRSLVLRDNKRLKKVPDTICELHSLVTLRFSGCLELAHLPKNMQRLVNLTHLNVTTKQKSLQESGIQYLENLHYLGLYGCENLEVLFEGTCQLTRLRKLEIVKCGRPVYVPFGALIALEYLAIVNSHLMFTQESNFPLNLHALAIKNSEQVMELLQCLEGSACTLETFSVYDCPSLTIIPKWLPNHTCLRLIRLIGCPNLSSMPQRTQSLSALKELHIVHCGEVSKRCEPQIGEDWHKIAHIPRIRLDGKRVRWTDD